MPGVGIWRTKSVEQSIADTDEPGSRLRRELTAKDLTVFGVAVVVGAGIFTLTARTAGNLARTVHLAGVRPRRDRVRSRRTVLRGVRLCGTGRRQRLHLLLRHLR